jgi:hypothetical protein
MRCFGSNECLVGGGVRKSQTYEKICARDVIVKERAWLPCLSRQYNNGGCKASWQRYTMRILSVLQVVNMIMTYEK